MMNRIKKYAFTVPIALSLIVLGCSSEGIDRNPEAYAATATGTAGTGSIQNDINPVINTSGPSRYVLLKKLNFEAKLPSVISVLFQASDQYGNAIPDLQTSDFTLLENDLPVSETETSLSIVPHQELPFTLRTVVMIDNSSSIQPDDLEKIKSAVSSLLVDDNGASRLLAQQEVALYTFDDTVTKIKDFSSNTASIVDAVNAIQPARSITPTDFYGAVIEGTSQWNDSFDLSLITQGSLIIITDGTDTAARHSYQEALNAVEGKSVYTLGIGDDISNDVMSSIGTADAIALRNFEQLNTTLQAINQQVKDTANSFYYLHYASPKRRAEGEEGDANSQHSIKLSVNNNANTGVSGTVVDTFNSAEFSNMNAEVVISGPKNMEIDQTATFRATTRWGPSPASDYLWSIPEENASCSMEPMGTNAVRITGVAAGSCTVSALDQAAGGARNWYSVTIIGD